MPQPQPPTLHIAEPGDVAQIIPYLVGFTPEESLVAIAIQHSQVQVTARMDLSDAHKFGGAEDLLTRILARFPGADIVTVAYTADHQTGWDVLGRCDNWLPGDGQAMLVDTDRWHTPDGATGPLEPHGVLATQATYYGLQHLAGRAELEARFASPPDSDELNQHLDKALLTLPSPDKVADTVHLTQDLIGRNLPGTTPISAQDAADLAVLVQGTDARDLALLSITPDNAADHLALWQNVLQNSPAESSSMALYVAGMAAWVSGDGASASIALGRSLAAEPRPFGQHPAKLLEGIIQNVVPPGAWDELRRDILDNVHPDVKQAFTTPSRPAPPVNGWPPAAAQPASPRREPSRRTPPTPGITH